VVIIGPTRWFVDHFRHPQRGGRTMYEIALIPEAVTYKICKKVYHGLDPRMVNEDVQPKDLVVTAWLNTREAYGKDELRLAKSLCQELAAEAIGECLRLQLFKPEGLEKYARQLVVADVLERSLQVPPDEIVQVEDIDLVAIMLQEEADRRLEADRVAAEKEHEFRERQKRAKASLNKSMELLFSNLPPNLVEEAKTKNTITVDKNGEKYVIPLQQHGFVKRYNRDGKLIHEYCLVFRDYDIPLGDEVLMKMILIKSDLKTFLAKANCMAPRYA